MKSIIRTHFTTIYRISVCVLFLMVLFFTKTETARIAPVAAVFVLLLSAGLIALRRARLLTLPFFLLCLLLIFCYDSYSVFIRYLWLLPVVVAALVIHLIRLRPRFSVGQGFFPLCAVALATALGGVGVLSVGEYFSPIALFYVIGLGPGLVALYLIFRNEMDGEAENEELLADFAAFCLTAATVMIGYRLLHLGDAITQRTLPFVQWGNNMATMLLLSVPAVFSYVRKHFAFLFAGAATLVAIVLTGSRGGMLFAPVLGVCCLFWLWLTAPEEKVVARLWLRFFTCFLAVCLISGVLLYLARVSDFGMRNPEDARYQLFLRSFSDFRESPLFGKGLAYRGNSDLYESKQGGINWYHMFFPQIIGSMGLCGILAWGWQLFTRARLAWNCRNHRDFAFALCYLGLFLMSQVNPGEFCPVPYAMQAIVFTVALENTGANTVPLKYTEKG